MYVYVYVYVCVYVCMRICIGLSSSGQAVTWLGIPLLAVGVAAMPLTLGYLSEQVGDDEVGALQGSADTVRSLASMVGGPLLSRAFAHFSTARSTRLHGGSLLLCSACSLTAFVLYMSMVAVNRKDAALTRDT